jgi:hypothetical protein
MATEPGGLSARVHATLAIVGLVAGAGIMVAWDQHRPLPERLWVDDGTWEPPPSLPAWHADGGPSLTTSPAYRQRGGLRSPNLRALRLAHKVDLGRHVAFVRATDELMRLHGDARSIPQLFIPKTGRDDDGWIAVRGAPFRSTLTRPNSPPPQGSR